MGSALDDFLAHNRADFENTLAHYGKLGMKWGHHKTHGGVVSYNATHEGNHGVVTIDHGKSGAHLQPGSTHTLQGKSVHILGKTSEKLPAHKEALHVSALHGIAKKSGTKALSNSDLKALNERLNLERNYNQLSPTKSAKGKALATGILEEVGKEVAKTYVKKGLVSLIGAGESAATKAAANIKIAKG